VNFRGIAAALLAATTLAGGHGAPSEAATQEPTTVVSGASNRTAAPPNQAAGRPGPPSPAIMNRAGLLASTRAGRLAERTTGRPSGGTGVRGAARPAGEIREQGAAHRLAGQPGVAGRLAEQGEGRPALSVKALVEEAVKRAGLPVKALSALPREVAATWGLIRRGGPFPYRRDGDTFENRERLLPAQPRGYYREYTVPTPGRKDRGARRLVAGRHPELYYSSDHYRSFVVVDVRG
jgi:ribonuclease T1